MVHFSFWLFQMVQKMFLTSDWYTYTILMFYAIPLPSTSVNQTLTFPQLTLNKIKKLETKELWPIEIATTLLRITAAT